jgi:hypothetical protein
MNRFTPEVMIAMTVAGRTWQDAVYELAGNLGQTGNIARLDYGQAGGTEIEHRQKLR